MESPSIIEEAGRLLRKPMSLADKDIEASIIELEAIRYELAEEKANTQKLLYEKRKQMLWPKDAEKNFTELDRTTRLNGDVASISRDNEFLGLIWIMVGERLEFLTRYYLENQIHLQA